MKLLASKKLQKNNNLGKYTIFAGVLLLAFILLVAGNNLFNKQTVQESEETVDLQQTTCTSSTVYCSSYNVLLKSYRPTGCQATERTVCENGCFYSSSIAQPARCIQQCKDASGNLLTFADGTQTFYKEAYSTDTGYSNAYDTYSFGSYLFVYVGGSIIKVYNTYTGALVSTIDVKGSNTWAQVEDLTVTNRGLYVVKNSNNGRFLDGYSYTTTTGTQLFSMSAGMPSGSSVAKSYTASDLRNIYLAHTTSVSGYTLTVRKFDTLNKVFTPVHTRSSLLGPASYEVFRTGDVAYVDTNKKLQRYTAAGIQLAAVDLGTFNYVTNLVYEKSAPYHLYVTVNAGTNYEARALKISPTTNSVIQTVTLPTTYSNAKVMIGGTMFVSTNSLNTIAKYNNNGVFANYAVKNVQFSAANNTYIGDGTLANFEVDNYGNVLALNKKGTETTNKFRKYTPC